MTTGLVMLASEQMMPNIEGLLAFDAVDPLNEVMIYCTNDEQRSLQPGRRLARFVRQVLPDVRVHCHRPGPDETGVDPAQVIQAIEDWLARNPVDSLVINATGGRKTMFAGVLGLVGRENTRILYYDPPKWLMIQRDEKGNLQTRAQSFDRSRVWRTLRKVGVCGMIGVQTGASYIRASKAPNLDAMRLLDDLVDTGWQWTRVVPGVTTGGAGFEHWFGALLVSLGCDDVRCNVEPGGGEEKRLWEYETDIWALKDGRLFFFDLKLITSQQKSASLAEQMNNAVAQARDLAGSMVGGVVLVRPGYGGAEGATVETIRLLGQRIGCHVWFQSDMQRLDRCLADLLQLDTGNPILCTLGERLDSAVRRHGYVFSLDHPGHASQRSDKACKGLFPMLDFERFLEQRWGQAPRWCCIEGDNALYCRIGKSDRTHMRAWFRQFQALGIRHVKLSSQEFVVFAGKEDADFRKRIHALRARFIDEPLFSFHEVD